MFGKRMYPEEAVGDKKQWIILEWPYSSLYQSLKRVLYIHTHTYISKHCIDISHTEIYHDIVWIPGACAPSCKNSLWLVRESWAIASYYYCTTKLCKLLVQWLLVLNRRWFSSHRVGEENNLRIRTNNLQSSVSNDSILTQVTNAFRKLEVPIYILV